LEDDYWLTAWIQQLGASVIENDPSSMPGMVRSAWATLVVEMLQAMSAAMVVMAKHSPASASSMVALC
jgi:hypothetical protein